MHISFKENILTGNVIKATMIYFNISCIIATANSVVPGKMCPQNLKSNDFLIFTELLTKISNNESIIELN